MLELQNTSLQLNQYEINLIVKQVGGYSVSMNWDFYSSHVLDEIDRLTRQGMEKDSKM